MSDGWSNSPSPQQQPPQVQPPQQGQKGFLDWNINNPWSFPRGWWPAASGQQPYSPPAQPRPSGEWGQPDFILQQGQAYQGGQPPWPMPQPNEIPGIMHQLTMNLGQNGPPGVAMPMIAAGRAYGRYAAMSGMGMGAGGIGDPRAFAAGVDWRTRHEAEVARAKMAEAADNLKTTIFNYSRTFEEFGPSKYDPGDPSYHKYDPQELYRHLHDDAMNAPGGPDQHMLGLLESKTPDAAERYAAWLDNNYQTLKQAQESEAAKEKLKAAQDAKNDEQLFGTGGGGGLKQDPAAKPAESPAVKPETPERKAAPTTAAPGVPDLPTEPVEEDKLPGNSEPTSGPAPPIMDQAGAPPEQAAAPGVKPDVRVRPTGQQTAGPTFQPGSDAVSMAMQPTIEPEPTPKVPPIPPSPQPPQPPPPPQQARPVPPQRPPQPGQPKPPPQRQDEPQWRIELVPDPPIPTPHLDAIPPASQLPGTPNMAAITAKYGWTQRQIDDFARKWIETGVTGFTGADSYDRGMSNIIKKRATQIIDYTEDVTNAAIADNPTNKQLNDATIEKILGRIREFSPDMADRAGPILKGNAPLATTGYAASSKFWIAEGNLIHGIDRNFNNTKYDVNRQTRLSFINGHSYPYLVRLATDRMLQHAAIAIAAVDALGNGPIPPANWIKQWVQEHWFGDPRPLSLRVILQHLSEEGNRVFRGNSGAEADIRREINNAQTSNSPAQIKMYLKAISDLLYEQQAALANVWNEGTGDNKTPEDMMFASGRSAYHRIQALTKDVPYYQPQWEHTSAWDNIQLQSPDGKFIDPVSGREIPLAKLPEPGDPGFYPPGYNAPGAYPSYPGTSSEAPAGGQ